MKFLTVCLFATILACSSYAQNVAVVIGGIGGGKSIEIIGDGFQCDGSTSNPKIPNAPSQLYIWYK